MSRALSLLLLLLQCSWVQADSQISVLVNPQIISYEDSGVFDLPKGLIPQPEFSSEQILEWKADYKGFNILLNTSYSVETIKKESIPSDAPPGAPPPPPPASSSGINELKGSTLEAYFEQSVNDFDFAIGKKITSWGIAYGFRPLDILQNINLQATTTLSPEGVLQLAADYYSNDRSITVLAARDTLQGDVIALRTYKIFNTVDLESLIAYSKTSGTQVGLANVWITNDSLSMHNEFLYQEKYSQSVNSLVNSTNAVPLSPIDPFESINKKEGFRFLTGLNYSFAKQNIIAEYWYDNLAYSKQQWDDLFALSKKQLSLEGLPGVTREAITQNIAFNLSATQTNQLMQHNIFIRWSQERDNWQPSAALLYAPEDRGAIVTINLENEFESFNFNVGARYFTGDKNSVYAQLIIKSQIYLALNRDF